MQFFPTIAKQFVIGCLLSLSAPLAAHAGELPTIVSKEVSQPLERVGGGTYSKLGFRIYYATLWAPGGVYDKKKVYALQLQYARNLSRETLGSAVIDNIREQKIADEATFRRWQDTLKNILPAVKTGDEIVALSIPGKNSIIYFNGEELAQIKERALSDAFFGIWFGPKANETLNAQLMGG